MAGIVMGDHLPLSVPILPVFMGIVVIALFLWRHAQVQSVVIALSFVVLGALLM